MTREYVHGYGVHERDRLRDQGQTLVDLVHDGTAYAADSLVLEAGCGIGVQTAVLAQRNPAARFVSIDSSEASLVLARRSSNSAQLSNVEFVVADIFALPFAAECFDHVFVCFTLEHLPDPASALALLQRCLKRGGTVTVVEGDHGSTYFHPDSAAARDTIDCLVALQARAAATG